MAQQTSEPPIQTNAFGLERLVFFSDAVFAIAITLLALEIRLPSTGDSVSDSELLHMLLAIWPKYLGYVISFLVIGTIWVGHHRKFLYIRSYDRTLILLNLLLLMSVAFIPFPTSLISEYGNTTATVFYAISASVASLLSGAVWWYASYRHRLIDPTLDRRMLRGETWRPLIVPVIFLISIGVAFYNNDVAKVFWGLAAIAATRIRYTSDEPVAVKHEVEGPKPG